METHSTTVAASPPISPPESILDSEILGLRIETETARSSDAADELLRPLFTPFHERLTERETAYRRVYTQGFSDASESGKLRATSADLVDHWHRTLLDWRSQRHVGQIDRRPHWWCS